MAFKLKNINVSSTGHKASPFKINDSLVMGAGVAARGFASDLGGASKALNKPVQVGPDGGGDSDTTSAGTVASTKCVDRDLSGEALKKCQSLTNQKFLTETKEQEEMIAKQKQKELDKGKKEGKQQDDYCIANPNKKACKDYVPSTSEGGTNYIQPTDQKVTNTTPATPPTTT